MQATVIKSTGSNYTVTLASGATVNAKIKGSFRIKEIKSTNPIAVGDVVTILNSGEGEYVITDIEIRKNYIIRKSINLSRQTHIIASNIDHALLVVTLAMPRTSTGFIDRFLVTAEAYQIPTTLVFNKVDLYGDEGLETLNYYINLYAKIGYKSIKTSTITGEGMSEIEQIVSSGNTLLSGHSGVGKSTLLNLLDDNFKIKTGIISEAHSKGKHTTTFAEMHKTKFGGFVIDTPGIKELGLVDIDKDELHKYFPEFRELSELCKFNNCTHINEPNCAVINEYEKDGNNLLRYPSYIGIYEQLASDK